MASIFPSSALTTMTSGITNVIKDNIWIVLGVIAFLAGLSLVMSWLDNVATDRMLDKYSKLWKGMK
jgi:hypothetical protein